MSEEWYASTDDCDWTGSAGPYGSREEAIAAAPEDFDSEDEGWGFTYYTALRYDYFPTINAGSLLDDLETQVHDNIGVDGYDWIDPSKEQIEKLEAALNAALKSWFDECGLKPGMWGLHKTQEHRDMRAKIEETGQ